MREEQSNMSKLFSPFGTRTEQYVKVKRGNELFFFILHFFERNKVKHVLFFLEINYYRVGSSRGNSWHRGFFLREYILSGVGIGQLFYATNNNAPRQPITLNLIHLITYDYNPCNILKLKRILLSDLSDLCFSLPFIKTQRQSASPTPPPI